MVRAVFFHVDGRDAHRRHAAGSVSVVEGAAFGPVAELVDRHDVDRSVDAPVADAGEPMAFLVAGRHV
jgi:hypothetical protein